MDGSDTQRGLYVNFTNANHTTGSNTLNGVDLAIDSNDAEATQNAINMNSNWDNGIVGTTFGTNIFDFTSFDVTSGGDVTLAGGDLVGANSEYLDIGETDNGSIIFGGAGETNNESLEFDFETTANTITLSSATGANAIDMTGFAITVTSCTGCGGGGGSLDTAYNSGGTITVDAYDVLFDLNDSTNDYGLVIDNNTAGTIDTGLEFTSGGGGALTTAIDASASAIGTAIAIGSNDITTTSTTISATELDRLDGKDAALVDQNDLTSSDGAGGTSSGSGMEAGTGGIGLLQGCSDDQILKWNESSSIWECASDRATAQGRVGSNYTTTTTTLANVTNMTFSVSASETWIFEFVTHAKATTTADHKYTVTAPASTTGTWGIENSEDTVSVSNIAFGTANSVNAAAAAFDVQRVNGSAVTTNSGSITLQYAQNAANNTSTVLGSSYFIAHKSSGADLAEVYYTKDSGMVAGTVVSLDPTLEAGVKKSVRAYDTETLGIISTQPGLTLGDEPKSEGSPVFLALSGRVPVRVNDQNGNIYEGDYLTSSSIPGVAMKATRAGPIIGQALTSHFSGGDGTVIAFIKNGFYTGNNTSKLLERDIGNSDEEAAMVISDTDPANTILDYFMRQKGDGPVGEAYDISEIVTDRLVAGLEIITPRVVADRVEAKEIVADRIRADQIEGLTFLTNELVANRITDAMGQLVITPASVVADQSLVASENESKQLLTTNNQQPIVDMEILGLLTAQGGLQVAGESQFIGNARFEGELEVLGTATFNSDTAGFATILAGQQEVKVTFDKEYLQKPIVTASANWEIDEATLDVMRQLGTYTLPRQDFIVANITTKGFTLILDQPAVTDLNFSWSAVSVRGAKTISLSPTLTPTPIPIPTLLPTGEVSPTPALSP